MSDLTIFLPRHDYEQKDDYDLIESILVSAGFNDAGVVSLGERAYRRYEMGRAYLMSAPEYGVYLAEPSGPQHYMYINNCVDGDVIDKLSVFGLNLVGLVNLGDVVMWQCAIHRSNLPSFAKLARSGVFASRRLVEEMSYFKWIDRGGACGSDWMDWFMAEWEANQKLGDILNGISVDT